MALPPRDDPRRAIQIAVLFQWFFGCAFLLLATGSFVGMVEATNTADRWNTLISASPIWTMGVVHIVVAIYLRRLKEWAVGLAANIALIYMVLLAFAFFTVFILPISSSVAQLVALILLALAIWALRRLREVLDQCITSMRRLSVERERGFAPVMPPRVEALPDDETRINRDTGF